jgi:hypothetical protein
MQNKDIHINHQHSVYSEMSWEKLSRLESVNNRSLWAQVKEDRMAIPEISGMGRSWYF